MFVEREVLEKMLNAGLSLAEIGEQVGKDPSTVGYWVKKHGLVPNGRAKHAPRGGLARSELELAVGDGLTLEEIGRRFGCSTATVRYWLGKHSLSTSRAAQVAIGSEAGRETQRICRSHGLTAFVLEGRGYYRCKACREQGVAEWRRRAKQRLTAEAGGACQLCGYRRYAGALQFHHVDPSRKEFALAKRGLTRGIAKLRVEASKCVLLCSNCHAEVEAGAADLPPPREQA